MFWIKYRYCTKAGFAPWAYVDLGKRFPDKEIDNHVQHELPHDPDRLRRSEWEIIAAPPVGFLADEIASLKRKAKRIKRSVQEYAELLEKLKTQGG